jgi:hypothetical protein
VGSTQKQTYNDSGENGDETRRRSATGLDGSGGYQSGKAKDRDRDRERERIEKAEGEVKRPSADKEKIREKEREREREKEREKEKEKEREKERERVPQKLERKSSTSSNSSKKEKPDVKPYTPITSVRKPPVPSFPTNRADALLQHQQQQLEDQHLEQQVLQQHLLEQHLQQQRMMQQKLEELQQQQQQKQQQKQRKRESRATIPGPDIRNNTRPAFVAVTARPPEPVNVLGSWRYGVGMAKQEDGKCGDETEAVTRRTVQSVHTANQSVPQLIGSHRQDGLQRSPTRSPANNPPKLTDNANYDEDLATITALLRSPLASPVAGKRQQGWGDTSSDLTASQAAIAQALADQSQSQSRAALNRVSPRLIDLVERRLSPQGEGIQPKAGACELLGHSDDSDSEIECDERLLGYDQNGVENGAGAMNAASGGSKLVSPAAKAAARVSPEARDMEIRREISQKQRYDESSGKYYDELSSAVRSNEIKKSNPFSNSPASSTRREEEERTKYEDDSEEERDAAQRVDISLDRALAYGAGSVMESMGKKKITQPVSPKFSKMSWQKDRGRRLEDGEVRYPTRRKSTGMSTNGTSLVRTSGGTNQRNSIVAANISAISGSSQNNQQHLGNGLASMSKDKTADKSMRSVHSVNHSSRMTDRERERERERDNGDGDRERERGVVDIEEAMRLLKVRGGGGGGGVVPQGDSQRSQSIRVSARIRK